MPLAPPELIAAHHDLDQFDCGNGALNDWLKQRGLANQARGFTVVMVVHDAGRVVGFYGIAPTAVEPQALTRSARTGQPPNPIPCLLLGQLAVDLGYRRLGVGKALVAHAIRRAVASADLTGGRALIVQAIDEPAAQFWRDLGFLPSPSDPFRLFRSLPDLRASVAAGG